jgi:hypothetical protein
VIGSAPTKIVLISLLACVAAVASDAPPEPASWIAIMGDSAATRQQRDQAAEFLVGMGREAIPALIDSLRDPRVFYPEYMPAGAPDSSNRWRIDLTVGTECDHLLSRIISGNRCLLTPGYPYQVSNWRTWWAKHQQMSLKEIQKEVYDFETAHPGGFIYWQH